MKRTVRVMVALALASPIGVVAAQEMSVDAQIAEAVSPLPESLRAGATVITRDAKGNAKVLRQGSNVITCMTLSPTVEGEFNVRCYAQGLAPEHEMMAKMLAEGKGRGETLAALKAAYQSGKLKPPPMGTMDYSKRWKTIADARVLWRLHLPNATAESLGLPTQPASGSPWMMWSGTLGAHIMMPQTEASLAAGPPKKP